MKIRKLGDDLHDTRVYQKEYARQIGIRIREERISRKMTAKEMADVLQISTTYYINIENGNRICPMEILIQICRKLTISSERLLRDFLPLSSIAASDIAQMLDKLDSEERRII